MTALQIFQGNFISSPESFSKRSHSLYPSPFNFSSFGMSLYSSPPSALNFPQVGDTFFNYGHPELNKIPAVKNTVGHELPLILIAHFYNCTQSYLSSNQITLLNLLLKLSNEH